IGTNPSRRRERARTQAGVTIAERALTAARRRARPQVASGTSSTAGAVDGFPTPDGECPTSRSDLPIEAACPPPAGGADGGRAERGQSFRNIPHPFLPGVSFIWARSVSERGKTGKWRNGAAG